MGHDTIKYSSCLIFPFPSVAASIPRACHQGKVYLLIAESIKQIQAKQVFLDIPRKIFVLFDNLHFGGGAMDQNMRKNTDTI
jgi:hypothetical protein